MQVRLDERPANSSTLRDDLELMVTKDFDELLHAMVDRLFLHKDPE